MSGPASARGDDERLCLALETATATASVALLRGSRVLARASGPDGQHHSETLLPMIDEALASAGAGLADVGAFAVSIGPGAFTSLRIGLATLKGLAFASPCPAVAVSTLQALALTAERAHPGPAGGVTVPVLDARRGEVYAGAYANADLAGSLAALAPVAPESVYAAAALALALPQGGRLVGEGASVVAEWLLADAAGPWSVEAGPPSVPDAVAVGLLGLARLSAGGGGPVAELVPHYLRRAEAEATRIAEPLEAPER
ncbi:MAG: tRNA (adenosine(37)-N6)-threonylcarbamoyltransferase complex dimerization subunit type 1 TsaB [Myxococcota bacterium]|nr:tRNA (adenosine(37)-N6)-threonylcarbamoyltransferase complex dimerization subunit type 1 TsaB [Myxococcota bacterium]